MEHSAKKLLKNKKSLPNAEYKTLGKEIIKKIKNLCRVLITEHSAKNLLKNKNLYRVPEIGQSAKKLLKK
jgi:hypothetical protein